MDKMTEKEGVSLDVVDENIQTLQTIFPEAFTEGRVDFEVLRQLLGDTVDEGEEKYGFNWHGKKKARQIALTPSTGTLRPCPEESVDWDTTQNLFVEGDNLEGLKLLQKSYANKVKMIYIDPPYNTGKEFIYPDKYQDNLDTYLRYTGQKGEGGFKTSSNTESSGRYHTNWLNMMYTRLKVARGLLRDDGVIFISIDDNEHVNLSRICSEIFGDENFIANFIWKRKAGGGDDSTHVATEHEYVLCYSKNIARVHLANIEHESPAMTAKYNREENGRRYYLERLDKTSLTYSSSMDFEIECPDKTFISPPQPDPSNPTTAWRWGKTTINDRRSELEFLRDKKTGEWRVYTRTWESLDGVTPRSLLVEKEHGRNRDGTRELSELLGPKIFNNPKPTKLLLHLVKIGTYEDGDILLDFFAGSGSLGHASQLANIEDGKMRRTITIQLPEKTERSDYSTIAEITKERLRRVAAKIKKENPDYEGDLGFKVFKLDSSNILAWNPDRNNLEDTLLKHTEHLVPGRSEEDILYELLLKRGVDLTAPIEQKDIVGKAVYSIGYGVLFACLDPIISRGEVEDLALGIIDWYRTYDIEKDKTQVVFRDSAFADDVAKTNMTAILEQNGITHVRSL